MVAETPCRGGMPFPEISIHFRTRERSLQIRLPPAAQIATLSGVVAIAVALSIFCLSRIGFERPAAKKAAIAGGEVADGGLRDEMVKVSARLPLALRDRQSAEARSSASMLPPVPASDETAVGMIERLIQRLDRALREKDRLRERVAELEQDVGHRRTRAGLFHPAGLILTDSAQPEIAPAPPEVLISDAPPEPEDRTRNVAQLARQAVAEARRLLASTGPKGEPPGGMTPDKLQQLRSLIKSLPLSVPLDYYQLESRFGPRRDPFNHRSSFHTGIDLSASYMSPVHATAAGTVTYAGYRSDYGKVVAIDHGNGISTVYGHLHRYIVSVGQRVAEHEQIGFLGSTGRSSGPHVHYEVLVNDEPQDPEKFVGLARVLPVAER
jgi:murein DD-endopeptidase MepM/ murein hydrolase activator NlpD